MKNEKLYAIAETLSKLTILEARELGNILKNDYGITPNKPSVFGIVPIALPTQLVEQFQFDIILKEAGLQKLQVVKKVKELTNLSLVESKTLVDSFPCVIKSETSKEEAQQFKKELEDLGATVEIK